MAPPERGKQICVLQNKKRFKKQCSVQYSLEISFQVSEFMEETISGQCAKKHLHLFLKASLIFILNLLYHKLQIYNVKLHWSAESFMNQFVQVTKTTPIPKNIYREAVLIGKVYKQRKVRTCILTHTYWYVCVCRLDSAFRGKQLNLEERKKYSPSFKNCFFLETVLLIF